MLELTKITISIDMPNYVAIRETCAASLPHLPSTISAISTYPPFTWSRTLDSQTIVIVEKKPRHIKANKEKNQPPK
jgi:hypothetical protein